jgi:hypothetical protein
MLTGETPFGERKSTELLLAHITEPPPHVAQKKPDLEPKLAGLVMQLLSKKREDRPPTAQAVLVRLLSAERSTSNASQGSFEDTLLSIPPLAGPHVAEPTAVDEVGFDENESTLPPEIARAARGDAADSTLASNDMLERNLEVDLDQMATLLPEVAGPVSLSSEEWRAMVQLGRGTSLKTIAESRKIPGEILLKLAKSLALKGLIKLDTVRGGSDPREYVADGAMETITRSLTETLGPIAGVVVRKAALDIAPDGTKLRAEQLAILVEKVSMRVTDSAKRNGFLRNVKAALVASGHWRNATR